jgi:hypothetical protein
LTRHFYWLVIGISGVWRDASHCGRESMGIEVKHMSVQKRIGLDVAIDVPDLQGGA